MASKIDLERQFIWRLKWRPEERRNKCVTCTCNSSLICKSDGYVSPVKIVWISYRKTIAISRCENKIRHMGMFQEFTSHLTQFPWTAIEFYQLYVMIFKSRDLGDVLLKPYALQYGFPQGLIGRILFSWYT